MSNYFEHGHRTFEAGTAIIKDRRVDFAADGAVDHAGAGATGIGVALRSAAVGEAVPVRLFTSAGTFPLVAGAAITLGDALDAAADGKVVTAAAGTAMGMRALAAAAADLDVIEAAALQS